MGAVTAFVPRVDAAPPPITYQGQVKFEGVPVNGPARFFFELYEAQTCGDPLSSVEISEIEVVNGLFTVELNFYRAEIFDG